MSIDARDTEIAKLGFRIREVSRVRRAFSWGLGFGVFVVTLYRLDPFVGDALMLLGGLAAAVATWWTVELVMSRVLGRWTAMHSRLVAERVLPRADVIVRRK